MIIKPINNFKLYLNKFNIVPLILFVILEVLLYGNQILPQSVVAIFEYFFLLILAFVNIRLAIAYFICFTLLSFGSWSYVVNEINPSNFWGFRFFGVSLNLIFSFSLIFILLIKPSHIPKLKFPNEIFYLFIFFGTSFILGIIYSNFKINNFDNFFKDLMIYFPIFIYSLLVFSVDENVSLKIFKYLIITTLISMVLSLLLGIFFEYGSGLKFILLNSFGYIIIFIVPFCKKLFTKIQYYYILIFTFFIILSGKFFIGGKFIIILLLAILWYFIVYKRRFFFVIFTLSLVSLLFFYWVPITEFLMMTFAENLLVQNKLSQVISIINVFDLDLLSRTPTSIGNIIAEFRTILRYYIFNPLFSITGLGFGGGVPDLFGYLAPLANPGMGYAEIDAVRNNYFRMHLPVFEFFLKSGLFGGFGFIYYSIKNFTNNNIFSFFFFLIFFTVFTNNKEMIMLSFLFLRLSYINFSNYNKI